jgi:endonuclease/exonuclease/phosphatase (EEP) superfamily protein YafD
LFLIILLKLIVLGAVVCSVAGSAGGWYKYGELTTHFKAQYLLASVVCLLLFLLYEEMGWALVAGVGLVLNLIVIAPWYIGGKDLSGGHTGGHRLKLLLANVNFESVAYESFLAIVQRRAPDVVVIQEVNSAWCEALRPVQDAYPFYEALPRGGGSGMALYSRFQFEKLAVVLPEGDKRPGILVKLNIAGAPVWLFSIHPRTPTHRGHFGLRNAAFAAAAEYLRNLPGSKICVGDLNITPWSPYYRRFIEQTGLVNVRKGFGLLPSWPTFLFFKWLMLPLDHCLISDGIRVVSVQTGEPIGSDHLPLLVELEIRS